MFSLSLLQRDLMRPHEHMFGEHGGSTERGGSHVDRLESLTGPGFIHVSYFTAWQED